MHTQYVSVKGRPARAHAAARPTLPGCSLAGSRSPCSLCSPCSLSACATRADDPAVDAGPTTTAEDGTTTTAGDSDGFTPEPIVWDDCGQVECANVEVPLDYADPDGERIEVYVVRTPASGERKGALFMNPGGPGAAGPSSPRCSPSSSRLRSPSTSTSSESTRVASGRASRSTAASSATELYGVDASIETPEDEDALLDVSQRYVADCTEKYGDLLPHVGTRDVARDMDAVRAAMGDEQLSYLGFSYGTAIGQVYADLFPDRVRSMVLDGVLELGPTGLELADEQARGFETALDRFVEFCDAAEGCEIAGESLQAVEEVLALAEAARRHPGPRR